MPSSEPRVNSRSVCTPQLRHVYDTHADLRPFSCSIIYRNMAPCAFNACCMDLLAFKTLHRRAAVCRDGWETSQRWFISCSVLYCKQGVVKHRCTPKWARFWEQMSIPRLRRYQQSDVARIKNKWVWDFDMWFSLSAHMGELLWNMNVFLLYIFYFGKCACLSVWMLVQRNAGLSEAGLFVCKQSQPVLFMSFKLHFHGLRQSAAIVPRNNVLC